MNLFWRQAAEWPCRPMIILLIATRNRLIIDPLGFLEALLLAFRELVACVSKPEKVTRVSFRSDDMPMIKTVGGQRGR